MEDLISKSIIVLFPNFLDWMYLHIKWHIIIWGATLLVFGFILFLLGSTKAMAYGFISFVFYVGVFYLNVLWIMPGGIGSQHMGRLLASWFGLLLAATCFSMLLNHALGMEAFLRNGDIQLEFINTFLKNILFIGVFLFIGVTYRYILDRYLSEKMNFGLQTEKLKTELDFLRAQVNPHFLFNSLNNIYALAYSGSPHTAETVMKLSDILRYMLYESGANYVSVSSEIHYLRLLLSLHQIRINGTMMLNFSVSGDIDKFSIAPLILISLVENVLKHGVLNDENNPAEINIHIVSSELTLSTFNKIDHAAKEAFSGIGMINIKRRLDLLYPGKHSLDICDDKIFYRAKLNLQLK